MNKMVNRLASTGLVCNCACDDLVTHANYVRALRSNFEWFRSSQYRIVPYNLIEGAYFSELTFQFLRMDPSVDKILQAHDMDLEAVELGNELLPEARGELTGFLEGISGARQVATVLADSRADLHGFYRGFRNVPNIASWLSDY